MKQFWFKPKKYNKKLITHAIESGASVIYVKPCKVGAIKQLAQVKVLSKLPKADLVLGKDVVEVKIDKKAKEAEVVKYKSRIPVIIKNTDWTIIPLENLISQTSNLIQTVTTAKQAKVALQTMEKGADGVILESDSMDQIKETGNVVRKANNEKLKLVKLTIVSTEILGIGHRVCIDTASILDPGQGMLAGDSSGAMFLVHNENVKSPYCDPRAFRVNIGAVHVYVKLPQGKTQYAGEFKSGSTVLACDAKGNTQTVYVGRAKIEKRPMILIKAKYNHQTVTLVVQNAETIRLTGVGGAPISITKLKAGDKVLGFVEHCYARHFGVKIKETIKEQ